MSRTINETRMLRYNFTAEEHLQNCDEAARLYDELSEMEASHRSIKASLKEQEKTKTSELARLMRLTRDKYDHRKIECRWIYDCPNVGQKTLRRNDTNADVEVRLMEDFEKQESLNLQPVTEALPLIAVLESTSKGVADYIEKNGGLPSEVIAAAKAYPAPPADFHGMKKATPPAMPETTKAEGKKRFGPK